jgi:hypothetical protein
VSGALWSRCLDQKTLQLAGYDDVDSGIDVMSQLCRFIPTDLACVTPGLNGRVDARGSRLVVVCIRVNS